MHPMKKVVFYHQIELTLRALPLLPVHALYVVSIVVVSLVTTVAAKQD